MDRGITMSLILAVLLCLSLGAAAQVAAVLSGTVRDPTGAILPAASVVLQNTATGVSRKLSTNSDEEYVAAAMPAGRYDLTVSAPPDFVLIRFPEFRSA